VAILQQQLAAAAEIGVDDVDPGMPKLVCWAIRTCRTAPASRQGDRELAGCRAGAGSSMGTNCSLTSELSIGS
jgi:hypothetical protein